MKLKIMNNSTSAARLSQIDRVILKALQENSDISTHDLADQLKISQSTLWRRIRELESVGAIERRVAILNPDVVGASVCAFVFVNLSDYEPNTLKAFHRFIEESDEILECYSITGEFDHMLAIRTKDVRALRDMLIERVAAHPSIATTSSHMTLERVKYKTALPL